MTTKMNCDINSGNITRVNNWKDVYSEVRKYQSVKENDSFISV